MEHSDQRPKAVRIVDLGAGDSHFREQGAVHGTTLSNNTDQAKVTQQSGELRQLLHQLTNSDTAVATGIGSQDVLAFNVVRL